MTSDEKNTKPEFVEFRKWLDSQDSTDEKTRRALCRLVDSTVAADGLSPVRLKQVQQRLFSAPNKAVRFRRLVFVSVALTVLSISGAIVVAREGYFSFFRAQRNQQDSPVREFPEKQKRPDAGKGQRRLANPMVGGDEVAGPTTQVETFEENKADPKRASIAIRRKPLVIASASTSQISNPVGSGLDPIAPEKPTGLSVESDMIHSAMKLARDRESSQAALDTLDAYEKMFPSGVLAIEARLIRVEALLLLDRKGGALKVLESMSLKSGGRETELLLLRGELRAPTDCSSAIVDFSSVLDRPAPEGYHERALFGRGVCYRSLGHEDNAGRDFKSYLARYPNGRFVGATPRYP